VTRLYKISEIPASLYWDEASIGYNAYSILKTGKDEWGEFLPLHFRAFGEFKLPVYIYSVAVVEYFLGLNSLAVRLPAVLFSIATLLFVYLLTKSIIRSDRVSILSSFFLAITPWYFIFSRTGYEATAGLMFFTASLYFYFLSIKKKDIYLLLSTIGFILSIYSYNSFRILVPPIYLLLIGYFLYQKREIFRSKLLIIGVSVGLLIVSFIPIFRLITLDAGGARFKQVGVIRKNSSLVENIYSVGTSYLKHASFKFLFLTGDVNVRSQQPRFGQLYLVYLPFLLIGTYSSLVRRKFNYFLLVLLMFLGPIPASITRESPHALRSILSVPFISIITAIGFESVLLKMNKQRSVRALLALVLILCLGSFSLYSYNFFQTYQRKSSGYWQYGYKQIYDQYADKFDEFEKVYITDQYGQPYIFALFYLEYDPEEFRKEVEYGPVNNWGFSTVKSFNKFEFAKLEEVSFEENSLIFALPSYKIENHEPSSSIEFLDGSNALLIYEI
jgi:4-amino-4-deoxy-L-arabinose transferase-like glycosyltransferase